MSDFYDGVEVDEDEYLGCESCGFAADDLCDCCCCCDDCCTCE